MLSAVGAPREDFTMGDDATDKPVTDADLLAWFEREREKYMAQPGATEAGFRRHIVELVEANPELAQAVAGSAFGDMLRKRRQ
jgi:hypothetical protein